jgi:hypothetical protein
MTNEATYDLIVMANDAAEAFEYDTAQLAALLAWPPAHDGTPYGPPVEEASE